MFLFFNQNFTYFIVSGSVDGEKGGTTPAIYVVEVDPIWENNIKPGHMTTLLSVTLSADIYTRSASLRR